MRVLRFQLKSLISDKMGLDSMTAQGQAENGAFNWLLAQSVVDNKTGDKYFTSLNDYQERNTEQAAVDCARVLASIVYGLPRDYEKTLPENKFLVKYKLADENLRLINKEGELVDINNKRIDEEGNYLDDDGNIVDFEGKKIDKEGHPIVEFKEFLDDDGEPLVVN